MVLLRLWGPVVVWMAVIFRASSASELGPAGRIPDWLTHGSAYLLLSVLICRALAGGFRRPLGAAAAVLAVMIAGAYGVSDEWHQSFVPGRDASAADVAKDLAGASLGAALMRVRSPRDAAPARVGNPRA
jgi:VanZ family protein